MNTITTLGEIRPSTTGDSAELFSTPLYALRRREWRVITPDECRVTDCLVCAWRKAGLLDSPRIVREPALGYACHSSYCPGCYALRCVCMPEDFEEVVYEHDYALGHDHGTADGPDNRPSRRWCADVGLYADAYLDGYDAACAGVALVTVDNTPRLWDELDDGLPF